MYEESIMDKKQSVNRSGQTQTKGFVAEGKKGQDVANKPWPRNGGRRREPAGTVYSNKNEPSRKPIPQRDKVVLDKRPKPRKTYHQAEGGVGGKEDAWLTPNNSVEIGSVFAQGSKKQNLNHLLNFHYTPRQNEAIYKTSSTYHRGQHFHKHKYNKEEFLQATCQFVVNSSGNYETYLKDPDTLVDWDLIEQINLQDYEFPCCPICLYFPVAAKITRCGHIYCWSCILHYLALSDKTWRKCPICFDAVNKQDLKSVISKPFCNLNVGDKIKMNLMRRERGSLIAVPVNEVNLQREQILKISESNINTVFSKLLLADDNDILMIIQRERNELEQQLSEDENCPEKCFIEQALSLLAVREKNILEKLSQTNQINEAPTKDIIVPVKNVSPESNTKEKDLGALSKYFYFYQASDGQHIYLNSLNIRMLEHMYGSLENCPDTIEGTIVEKESCSITDELRKRMRYLQHLPITCQFEIAELEFKPPIVTEETLSYFKDQIEHRRKRRQKRARDERKHEKRVIEKENRMMGKYPTPHIHIESTHQFPHFGGGSFEGTSPPLSTTSIEDNVTNLSESFGASSSLISDDIVESTSNLHIQENSLMSGPSFATMLSKTKTENMFYWPELKDSDHKRTPHKEPKIISAVGKRCQVGFNVTKHQKYSDSELEIGGEGYAPVPSYNKSFSDAIALALEQSAKQACSDEKPAGVAGDHTSDHLKIGKKKKKNRKLLFTTSMACTGK